MNTGAAQNTNELVSSSIRSAKTGTEYADLTVFKELSQQARILNSLISRFQID